MSDATIGQTAAASSVAGSSSPGIGGDPKQPSNRDRIIEALLELAAEREWNDFRLSDVAERAGVSLADFRDAMLMALLCSVALRDVRDTLVASCRDWLSADRCARPRRTPTWPLTLSPWYRPEDYNCMRRTLVMSLLLLVRLPFSWLIDTARDFRQAYGVWRTSARSYMRAHSKQQVGRACNALAQAQTTAPDRVGSRTATLITSLAKELSQVHCLLNQPAFLLVLQVAAHHEHQHQQQRQQQGTEVACAPNHPVEQQQQQRSSKRRRQHGAQHPPQVNA